jgi:hypothetical protein
MATTDGVAVMGCGREGLLLKRTGDVDDEARLRPGSAGAGAEEKFRGGCWIDDLGCAGRESA